MGASQNRFESTITNLNNTVSNLSAARSRIQDSDYATEVSNMSRAQILQQAGSSVLAQANQFRRPCCPCCVNSQTSVVEKSAACRRFCFIGWVIFRQNCAKNIKNLKSWQGSSITIMTVMKPLALTGI
ncbi:flagellin [Kosakonia cowanii]|uniref:flagellin n=1 Tax=Kosakonia cowanii TaxID=208223 RepID=UPI002DDDA6E5|nr:flagellin [Kosakonia cowanii]WRY61790.1 flagellin [Kosakonia cowanii]